MTIHTEQTAPEASLPALQSLTQTFGWAPNVLGAFAGSPVLIESYRQLHALFAKQSAFSPAEQEIIQITNNIENNCTYCMAAHSTVVAQTESLTKDDLEALRQGQPLSDPKHNALRTFTLALLKQRGHADEAQQEAFLSAGYSQEQALEIIVHIAFKVITNFTNNLAQPELDAPFQAQSWRKDS